MRLVMLYTFGDGCTYSCDSVFPMVSESPEQALCDFCAAYEKAKNKYASPMFDFAGEKFHHTDFEWEGKFEAPEFLTIDEWFARVEV